MMRHIKLVLFSISLASLQGCAQTAVVKENVPLNPDLGYVKCGTDVNIQRDLSSDAGYNGIRQLYLDDTGTICTL